jgi:uncharacterized protein YeeX (DUF496 family)
MIEGIGGNKMNYSIHPLRNQDQYIKETYISMLFACSACDGDINAEEQKYIRRISENIGCNEKECLENMYRDFNKLVEAFKLDFTGNNVIYTFICDAFLAAYCDGDLNEKEINFISRLAETANLNKRLFEYFYSVAELSKENRDISYIVAILSKPIEIDFKLFKYCFEGYDKNQLLNNEYVLKTIDTLEMLNKIKRNTENFIRSNRDRVDAVQYIYESLQPPLEDTIEQLEDLTKEIKQETGKSLIISDDDIYWEVVNELSELDDLTNQLFADIAMIELCEENLTLDLNKRMTEIINYTDKIIIYLRELKDNI